MLGLFVYCSSYSVLESEKLCRNLASDAEICGADDLDDLLDRAYSESLTTRSVMPILKQELQFKIQYSRLSRGEPEIVLEEDTPRTYELTEEEIIKKQRRLEQNRRSAIKSRKNSKQRELRLMKKVDVLVAEQKKLSKQLEEIKEERNMIHASLEAHLIVCKNDNPAGTQR